MTHNFNKEYDRNGSIFMDPACDVLKSGTNLILYGHHMRSGNMFGDLDKYESREYMEKHATIEFDTLYEKGTYKVMYVFRDRLRQDTEITFKYYQFIEANSAEEFASNMNAMAEMSFYDTGVKAAWGDQLLTLSAFSHRLSSIYRNISLKAVPPYTHKIRLKPLSEKNFLFFQKQGKPPLIV